MTTQYVCRNLRRRDLVRAATDENGHPFLNGIDFLEVSPTDHQTLIVHFIHNLPGQPNGVPSGPVLTADNFRIEGGVRLTDVRVDTVAATSGHVITLTPNHAGDFSTYTLRLVSSPVIEDPPVGFDPMLAEVEFSFKIHCDSDFDCAPRDECPERPLAAPYLHYLAKDYASFRRLILDRLAVVMPDWRERNPADLGIALVEVLAYVGDHLSYFQDAVATEAYLGTARRRVSVRRHARLVDYAMHEGVNARAWLVFETQADRGSALSPAVPTSARVIAASSPATTDGGAIVFETLHEVTTLKVARNAIAFYTWGDTKCCLPKGATRATLDGAKAVLDLNTGDVLIVEEVLGAESGLPEDADRTHRHAVRLIDEPVERIDPLTKRVVLDIAWHADDALPFPLCLHEFDDGAGGVIRAAVARGNVALADQGLTFTATSAGESLVPPTVPEGRPYRPLLARRGLTHAAPYDHADARRRPAAVSLRVDVRDVLPAVLLRGEGEIWRPRRDLLGSDRFAPDFVVEMEEDGAASLRFGDDVLGRRPSAGTAFKATYRLGNGKAGNVGAEALTRLVPPIDGVKVRNPMAAVGGVDPEPIREVKLYAPQAFRTQERAVTEADYAVAAQRHPEVQRAAATRRWTGSWYTMFVTVDRRGGRPVDATFEQALRDFLEPFRMAGYDLEIDAPRYVPLDLALSLCVVPHTYKAVVKQALLDAFSNRDLPDGSRGFFHPDHFTFGQPVYLSQIIARAMAVPGVRSVIGVDRFQRYGQDPHGEIDEGFIPMHRLEIARLDNDRNAQENGRLELVLLGGL
ncbi:putative baseplate assembly protein [Candidatus Nitrospira bockiana]